LLEICGLGYGTVVRCCECGNERLSFVLYYIYIYIYSILVYHLKYSGHRRS
jgi:hypothetical protein